MSTSKITILISAAYMAFSSAAYAGALFGDHDLGAIGRALGTDNIFNPLYCDPGPCPSTWTTWPERFYCGDLLSCSQRPPFRVCDFGSSFCVIR